MVAHLDDHYPDDETYEKVIWCEGGFYTKEKGSIDIHPFNSLDKECYEVCGNTFDNPELL